MLDNSCLCRINRPPALRITKMVTPAQRRPRTVQPKRRHANCPPKKFNRKKRKKVIFCYVHLVWFCGNACANRNKFTRKPAKALRCSKACLDVMLTASPRQLSLSAAATFVLTACRPFLFVFTRERKYSWNLCVRFTRPDNPSLLFSHAIFSCPAFHFVPVIISYSSDVLWLIGVELHFALQRLLVISISKYVNFGFRSEHQNCKHLHLCQSTDCMNSWPKTSFGGVQPVSNHNNNRLIVNSRFLLSFCWLYSFAGLIRKVLIALRDLWLYPEPAVNIDTHTHTHIRRSVGISAVPNTNVYGNILQKFW